MSLSSRMTESPASFSHQRVLPPPMLRNPHGRLLSPPRQQEVVRLSLWEGLRRWRDFSAWPLQTALSVHGPRACAL